MLLIPRDLGNTAARVRKAKVQEGLKLEAQSLRPRDLDSTAEDVMGTCNGKV
jgi:hypothetical protein